MGRRGGILGRAAVWHPKALGAAVAVLLAAGGAAIAADGGRHAGYAAGWDGTRGTLTVAACRMSDAPDPRERVRTCTGVFVSRDGSVSDPSASITRSHPGAKVDVVRARDGSYRRAGVAAVLGWTALVLLGLLVLGLGVLLAWGVFRPPVPRRSGWPFAVAGGLAAGTALAAAIASRV